MSKCNNGHIYGSYNINENSIVRVCKCCGEKTTYPLDADIITEIKKQEEASLFVNALIQDNGSIINNSDDVIRLFSGLLDNIFYINTTKENQEQMINKMQMLVINTKDDFPDKSLLDDVIGTIECFRLFFRKEQFEIALGIDNWKNNADTNKTYEETCEKFDIIHNKLLKKFDKHLSVLYDNSQLVSKAAVK